MLTLFPLAPQGPPGFSYEDDFITTAEENLLAAAIRSLDLHSFRFHGYEAKRRVAGFGYDWNFETRTLAAGQPIPAAFDFIVQRVAARLAVPVQAIAELLLTEYPVGAVINWHRDAPPFETIAGISLLADCSFRFRPHDKTRQGRNAVISLPVKRRSLYVMRQEAREAWEHSIPALDTVRYSITFRTLKASAVKV